MAEPSQDLIGSGNDIEGVFLMARKEPDDGLTLRELLEAKRSISILETRLAASEKALELQAESYKEHLDRLNGEQTRLASDRERFLPRESHESYKREQEVKHVALQKQMDLMQSTIDKFIAVTSGRNIGISISWGVVLSVLNMIVVLGLLFMRR